MNFGKEAEEFNYAVEIESVDMMGCDGIQRSYFPSRDDAIKNAPDTIKSFNDRNERKPLPFRKQYVSYAKIVKVSDDERAKLIEIYGGYSPTGVRVKLSDLKNLSKEDIEKKFDEALTNLLRSTYDNPSDMK